MIVLEGVDNTGKSTLAQLITKAIGWPIRGSEGPPQYPGEMNVRVNRYFNLPRNTIFDRHPVVSQLIYGKMRTHHDPIDAPLVELFYSMKPLFIYCDPLGRGLDGHVLHEGIDSEHHLRSVNANYSRLLEEYRQWALKHAVVIYRIGDDTDRILRMIRGQLHLSTHDTGLRSKIAQDWRKMDEEEDAKT